MSASTYNGPVWCGALSLTGMALKIIRVKADASGFELADESGASGTDWGSIGGTLSDQTDLQSALDAKVPTSRTVAGHALSGDVTIAAGDLSNGTTGSGAVVLASGATLATPTLGVASATSINKVTITAPATGSTLTIDDGFTLHVTGNVTALSGSHTGSSSGTNTGDQSTFDGGSP